MTIREIELSLEELLDRVRLTSSDTALPEALEILAGLRYWLSPPDFKAGVHLEEDRRKKRSSTAARHWKFSTGEIVISYEEPEHDELDLAVRSAPVLAIPVVEDKPRVDESAELRVVNRRSRFNPVPILGEPASTTLLRDRGEFSCSSANPAHMKLFVSEPGSSEMVRMVEQAADSEKTVSALAAVEVRSAIRRRERAGELTPVHAARAVQSLEDEYRRVIEHPLSAAVLARAVAVLDRHALRSLDALQLATALHVMEGLPSNGAMRFVCSDGRLLEAARLEGLDVWNPEQPRA